MANPGRQWDSNLAGRRRSEVIATSVLRVHPPGVPELPGSPVNKHSLKHKAVTGLTLKARVVVVAISFVPARRKPVPTEGIPSASDWD